MTLVRIENLTIDGILEGISFDIQPGERLGLIGESGSGKSMTALTIMGLLDERLKPSGTVMLDGADMINSSPRVKRKLRGTKVGMIFQEPMTALDPLMTVERQVAEACSLDKARELLHEVGVDRTSSYPHELSGGQRQRVLIALAIAGDPDLLICDEPTTALDVEVQQQILDLLDSLVRERGMALLFITHDLAVIRKMIDRVIVLKGGRIVDQNADLDAPKVDYTAQLVEASKPKSSAEIRATGEPIIELKDVTWRRGSTVALDNVNLTVHEGERVGIVGGSGSGKTSLLRVISGLNEPDSGTVRVDGDLQMVFQDPYSSLNPRRKVRDSIREAGVDEARADEVLSQVGLEGMGSRFPSQFSGGQRQRISIARAAAPHPEILIADEPVSALDVSVRAQVLELIDDLVVHDRATLIFVSHDLSVVRQVCPSIAVLYHGKIVEMGPTEEVWANPQHEYTQKLLAAIP
ncbi:peptide/nickel transport system ATP-binding protein [Corynebacterium appendicis CIP 107643]|uniref:Peptide/nickel transport system ATP-binding protein n=1 Tax=Corynebacterium appendicis CIP 107643 TaxID=1161099 RepID=A0A1N7JKI1_9CORY|nr:ABC transporter ATP-binding protein [Corynebacterium appendicis]WJY61633.1 Glutathione import ATP-binding protein GsiA [Corynebacterium appendicis CIP 107643]SIS49873.1 peptide/nickel transport system ATP-binding protein [Corynebacterium appendicis CIP 107643]